ncbi:MAG: Uma2 family endonuclease, partial [Candidatus Eremiobacteraeota bacterium]|nr:Uma2 family endonuclease [Candidatus Eremiobacteraeota bacterium]
CPQVVVEVRAETDSWATLQEKIERYRTNGAGYALAIDPYQRDTFAVGQPPPGLILDIKAIIDA